MLIPAAGDQSRVDVAIKAGWHHPGTALAWYLSLSYLYYKLDISAATDGVYDKLAYRLLDWAERVGSREHSLLLAHPHASLLDIEALKAGTGYQIDKYPERTERAAIAMAVTNGFLVDDTRRSQNATKPPPKPKPKRRKAR